MAPRDGRDPASKGGLPSQGHNPAPRPSKQPGEGDPQWGNQPCPAPMADLRACGPHMAVCRGIQLWGRPNARFFYPQRANYPRAWMPLQAPACLHGGTFHPLPSGHELEWLTSQAPSGLQGQGKGKGKGGKGQGKGKGKAHANGFGAAFVSGDEMVNRHLKTSHHMATEHSREHFPWVAVRPDQQQPLPGAGRGRTLEAEAPVSNYWTPLQESQGTDWEGQGTEWEGQEEEEDAQILYDLARSNTSPSGSALPNHASLHGSRGIHTGNRGHLTRGGEPFTCSVAPFSPEADGRALPFPLHGKLASTIQRSLGRMAWNWTTWSDWQAKSVARCADK